MELEPRCRQRWAASVGEGAPHRTTGAPHDFRLVVGTSLKLPFSRTDAPHLLFQDVLGMAIGVRDGLGGFTPRRARTPLGRHARQGLCHGGTDGGLAVRDAPDKGPLESLLPLLDQVCQIVVGG
jgi:hypothetical protein